MLDKAIDGWFRNVVWPFSEHTGLDTFQSQAVCCGGPILWCWLFTVGVLWWRSLRRRRRPGG